MGGGIGAVKEADRLSEKQFFICHSGINMEGEIKEAALHEGLVSVYRGGSPVPA